MREAINFNSPFLKKNVMASPPNRTAGTAFIFFQMLSRSVNLVFFWEGKQRDLTGRDHTAESQSLAWDYEHLVLFLCYFFVPACQKEIKSELSALCSYRCGITVSLAAPLPSRVLSA